MEQPETPYEVAHFLNVGLQTWNPLQFMLSTSEGCIRQCMLSFEMLEIVVLRKEERKRREEINAVKKGKEKPE